MVTDPWSDPPGSQPPTDPKGGGPTRPPSHPDMTVSGGTIAIESTGLKRSRAIGLALPLVFVVILLGVASALLLGGPEGTQWVAIGVSLLLALPFVFLIRGVLRRPVRWQLDDSGLTFGSDHIDWPSIASAQEQLGGDDEFIGVVLPRRGDGPDAHVAFASGDRDADRSAARWLTSEIARRGWTSDRQG